MPAPLTLLVTCEHGGNQIPSAYRTLFAHAQEVLQSHRGWDPGALELARKLARHFKAPLISSTTSRLVVELNRSPHHPRLFSEFMDSVSEEERQKILAKYYTPYRDQVRDTIRDLVSDGQEVLHLSIHSFTPVLNGKTRTAELGLLFDPSRTPEARFCQEWQRQLRETHPDWRVRRNYPYRGTDDGLTTALRKLFRPESYRGIELEVTQAWPLAEDNIWKQHQQELEHSLAAMLARSR